MRCSASCENNQRRVAENRPAEAVKSHCQHGLGTELGTLYLGL